MLLTKEVETTINRKNLEWYLTKGYNCNLKDKIIVKVNDLMMGSNAKVTYKCDMCGIEKSIKYTDYIKSQKLKPNTYCNNCANIARKNIKNNKYFAKDDYKICKQCNRKLPANNDYYFKNKRNKDSFSLTCKECEGYSFTTHLTKIPQDGHKFCIKCGREFPIDVIYFPPDKMCKDGLRNVCRECGKDGHFMKKDYKIKHYWTGDELELFIKRYPLYTSEELRDKFYPNLTEKQIWDTAYRLRILNNDLDLYKIEETKIKANIQKSEKMSGENSPLYGVPLSEERKRKLSLSKKGKYVGINNALYGISWDKNDKRRFLISERTKGKWSGDKNPRHINPLNGQFNGRWQGGIKQLYYDLRDHLQGWKRLSMEICNYKCALTNGKFDNIHHLYNFKNIVDEVFEELEFPLYKTIGEYSKEERNKIYNLLNKKHIEYGFGVCLCAPLHRLFHNIYGYTNNTVDQFKEFEIRYFSFEFDDLLDDNYKFVNININ
jgi:hypothetical protein